MSWREIEWSDADREMLAELGAPAPEGAEAGVTRYLYEVYKRRPDLRQAFPDLDGEGGERFVEWAYVYGREEIPIVDELLPPAPDGVRHLTTSDGSPHPSPGRRWGVNVVGYLSAELGLGEGARQLISGLDAAGVALLPVEARARPGCRHEHPYESVPPSAASFPINLLCTNPDGLLQLRREVGPEFLSEHLSVGLWWWEVECLLPFEWYRAARQLDELWVASSHVAECVSRLAVPVVPITLPVSVPDPPPLSRQDLGLPPGFLFLFLFDFNSTFKRKNPLAAVEAFKRAFPPDAGASLVLKCINREADPEGHARLISAASEHPQIRVIDDYVSPAEKNAMIAACDCYVSLHRAEGFGHTPAEAMYLGKPVIATGYSGNLEFMTPDNSHLVDYEEIRVGDGAWPYLSNGVWAEPDIDHASRLMRHAFDDPEASRRLGARAAEDIRRTHSPAAAGAALLRRLELLAERLPESAGGESPEASNLIAQGVGGAGPRGTTRALARRLALRAMRPYTEYQRRVNERLLARADAADALAAGALDHSRQLELELAEYRAATLAAGRVVAFEEASR